MKKTTSYFILITLFVLVSSLFCLTIISCKSNKLQRKIITIQRSDSTTITVDAELAITPEERTHGFMERKTIPDGTGMLFIFERDQILSFWMKNTPHPLSIAYIDSKGQIRDIYDMKPFSLESITSTVSVRYALEVPQGWFVTNNIKTGDYVSLDFLKK